MDYSPTRVGTGDYVTLFILLLKIKKESLQNELPYSIFTAKLILMRFFMSKYLNTSISFFVLLTCLYTSESQAVRWQGLDEERKQIVMKMNDHRKEYASGANLYLSYFEGIQFEISVGCHPNKETNVKFPKKEFLLDWKIGFRQIKSLIDLGQDGEIFSEENKKGLKKVVKEIYKNLSTGLHNIENEFDFQYAKEYSDLNTEQLSSLITEFNTTTLPTSFGGALLPKIAHKLWSDVEPDSSVPSSTVLAPPAPKEEQKPILSFNVLDLQKRVQGEFAERQHLGGGETVMVFGSIVAPMYYYQMRNHEEEIFGHSPSNLVSMRDLSEVQNFYNKLNEDKTVELGNELEGQMRKALTMSKDRTSSDTAINNPKEFLLRTFGLLRMQYERHKNSPEMVMLLNTAFYTFAEQDGQCTRGLLGRTIQIYKEIFDFGIRHKLTSAEKK